MKIILLSIAATFFTAAAYAKPLSIQNLNTVSGSETGVYLTSAVSSEKSSAAPLPVETFDSNTAASENLDLFGQDRPRKAKKGESDAQPKKGKQEVKEVATARRQEKPRKVSDDRADLDVTRSRTSAARPQSAARPVRGVAGSAVKAGGNAAKAMKAAKPVKVNAGRIKVGKH